MGNELITLIKGLLADDIPIIDSILKSSDIAYQILQGGDWSVQTKYLQVEKDKINEAKKLLQEYIDDKNHLWFEV